MLPVSSLTAYVCITHHENFQVYASTIALSLSAMSLGDWFYVSRKVRTEGGRLVHPDGETSMATLGLAVKIVQ